MEAGNRLILLLTVVEYLKMLSDMIISANLTLVLRNGHYHLGWDNAIRTNDCIVVGDWRDPPYTTINSYAGVFSTFTAYSILSGSDIRGSRHSPIIN